MMNYRQFLNRNIDWTSDNFNVEAFLVEYNGFKPTPNGGVFNKYLPLTFTPIEYDESNVLVFKSFASASNRVLSSYNSTLIPLRIGKSDIIYANYQCAFTKDKKPLYIVAYTINPPSPDPTNFYQKHVVLSTEVLFNDNSWLNNMRLKIFKVCKYFDAADIIVDDELINGMVYRPQFNGDIDFEENIKPFLIREIVYDLA